MSMSVICDPVGTIVHVGARVPLLGALMCVGVVAGGLSMTGPPDDFGGCGETGGNLMQVVQVIPETELVCAVPVEPPVQKEP